MKMDDYNKAMARLEISDQCEERIMDMMNKEKKIRRHINKKAILISVLAAAVACSSICAAAAFGGLRRNQEVWQQERAHVGDDGEVYTYAYDKFDHNNYDMLASVAEAIPEEDAAAQTEEISVSAEDAFCDGRHLYLTFRAEVDVPGATVLNTDLIVTVNGEKYSMPTAENTGYMRINMMLLEDQAEPGIFYGSLNYLLPEILTETPEISVTCKGFQCYRDSVFTDENFVGRLSDWVTVDIPVTIQPDALHVTEVGYEGAALHVQSVEQSPSGIAVTYSHHAEAGIVSIYDADGKGIRRKTDTDGYLYSGDWITEFFEATDTDSITIRLVDKNTDPLETLDEVTVSLK